jgi:ribonuclease HI
MRLKAFTDGASRGNPGASGVGIIVRDEQGKELWRHSECIGTTTNNIAEYTALLRLLAQAPQFSCSALDIHSDSELMVRQMRGEYKVRDPKLKLLHRKATALMRGAPFTISIQYVPRERNAEADRLANLGIDAGGSGADVQGTAQKDLFADF